MLASPIHTLELPLMVLHMTYQAEMNHLAFLKSYAHHSITPKEACSTLGVCCLFSVTLDGTHQLALYTYHLYNAQVQGQMVNGGRQWCLFYTPPGVSVSKGYHLTKTNRRNLLPWLVEFYDHCLGMEIVSPEHALGLPFHKVQ